MRFLRAALASAVLLVPIVVLARAPYTPPHGDVALLRFSWRMSINARERCRLRTEHELEELPVHMRTPEVCTRDIASYALIIRIDDQAPDTLQLARGGVKRDRPLFVLEQRRLNAGRYRIRAALERSPGSGTEVLATLDSTLTMTEGSVYLVTLPAGSRRLSVLTSDESVNK